MILELINKVIHGKPSLKSVLCNRKISCNSFNPYFIRSKTTYFIIKLGILQSDMAFKNLF